MPRFTSLSERGFDAGSSAAPRRRPRSDRLVSSTDGSGTVDLRNGTRRQALGFHSPASAPHGPLSARKYGKHADECHAPARSAGAPTERLARIRHSRRPRCSPRRQRSRPARRRPRTLEGRSQTRGEPRRRARELGAPRRRAARQEQTSCGIAVVPTQGQGDRGARRSVPTRTSVQSVSLVLGSPPRRQPLPRPDRLRGRSAHPLGRARHWHRWSSRDVSSAVPSRRKSALSQH